MWGLAAPRARRGARSPAVARVSVAAAIVACLLATGATADPPSGLQPVWGTDGSVSAVVVSGSTAYIGGQFTHVGPASSFATGSFVQLDATTGQAHGTIAPVISGMVFASAPDGSGGWYIGGDFFVEGAMERARLAHIRSDGTLDPNWAASANATVMSLVVSGSSVYAGGFFTMVNGSTQRNRLAAFDATSGVVTSFDPNLNAAVRTLGVSGSTLYAGGDFTTVNSPSQPRNRLAAFDTTIATANATPFDPDVDGSVSALAVSGSTIFAGGIFTVVNGSQTRNHLASFAGTDGAVTQFDPNVAWTIGSAHVNSLVVSGSAVYAGGVFDMVNGSIPRNHLAAFNPTTGAVELPFDPNLNRTNHGSVHSLALAGDGTVYVGGGFTMLNSPAVSRLGLARIDPSSGLAMDFEPTLNPSGVGRVVRTIQVSGASLYAGGDFGSAGGVRRSHIAAIDLTTGEATDFDPDVSNGVNALALSGSTLYAGGVFNTVNGSEPRRRLAAFDTGSADVTDFDAGLDDPNDFVYALAVSGSTVYAGGDFATVNVGNLPRSNLAAFDATTGIAKDFAPNPNQDVDSLAVSGSTVYAGGTFTSVDGAPRFHIAAIDSSGTPTAFDPGIDGSVYAVAVDGGKVYVGGDFSTVNGGSVDRNSLAAFDRTSGVADPAFDPDVNGAVLSLAVAGSTIYAGGIFTAVNGAVPRGHAASFDAAEGDARSWNPSLSGGVHAMGVGPSHLVVGGTFTAIDDSPVARQLAVFTTRPGPPSSVSASAGDGQATVSFAAPGDTGAEPIGSYTVSASPGGATASGTSSPIIIGGLANGTAYTFTVKATNALGAGPASLASNAVTPTGPPAGGGGGGGGGGAAKPDVGVTLGAAKTSFVPSEAVEIRVTVSNKEFTAATGLRAVITLPAGVTLLGSPAFERGSGCTGTSTLDCNLDYLPAGASTLVRFSINVGAAGAKTIGARVSASSGDLNEQDNSGSLALQVVAAPPQPPRSPASPAAGKGLTKTGTNGPNTLTGTTKADTLSGRGGNDRLSGGAGNDRLFGGSGNDRLLGGAGLDLLDGGPGNDTITANDKARDTIRCGPGRDTVVADRVDTVARDCEAVRRR